MTPGRAARVRMLGAVLKIWYLLTMSISPPEAEP